MERHVSYPHQRSAEPLMWTGIGIMGLGAALFAFSCNAYVNSANQLRTERCPNAAVLCPAASRTANGSNWDEAGALGGAATLLTGGVIAFKSKTIVQAYYGQTSVSLATTVEK